MPFQHWQSTLPCTNTVQEEQVYQSTPGHIVPGTLSPGWVCTHPPGHVPCPAAPGSCTAGGRVTSRLCPGHQCSHPCSAPAPSPHLTGTAVTLSVPSVPGSAARPCAEHRQGDRSPAHAVTAPGLPGCPGQVYLCPCSVSCHCHEAPEPHRFQLRHHWEQQL